jgi:hypothetical protein
MMVVQQTAPAQPTDPAVEDELDRLPGMPIAELRVRYREVFRTDPPKAFGPDLLRRSIAHRIQEKAYGGLSRSAQRLLDQMMKAYAARPNGKIVLPRRGNGRARAIGSRFWPTGLSTTGIPTAISPKSRS